MGMTAKRVRSVLVKSSSGEVLDVGVEGGTILRRLVGDFLEGQGQPVIEALRQGSRPVVELEDPKNPDKRKRLQLDLDICDSPVVDGDTLVVTFERIGAEDAEWMEEVVK